MKINCPKCGTNNIRKTGHRRGKQNYQCKECGRQFVEFYSQLGYSKEIKENCLTMYVNGNGFRAIERITEVNHNTVIRWIREAGKKLMKENNEYIIPLVSQLDELQTFVRRKKDKIWLWTSVDKNHSSILEWDMGDRSAETLEKLGEKIKRWNCYFWITDGYKVAPKFIPDGAQIISKISMTLSRRGKQ